MAFVNLHYHLAGQSLLFLRSVPEILKPDIRKKQNYGEHKWRCCITTSASTMEQALALANFEPGMYELTEVQPKRIAKA